MPYTLSLTTAGANAIAAAISGAGPLVNLSHIAIGSADGALLNPASTTLGDEIYRGQIVGNSLRESTYSLVLTIPADVGGFYMREIGVFDPSNQLIAYATFPENYKPRPSADSAGESLTITLYLVVANANVVTIEINPAAVLPKIEVNSVAALKSLSTTGFINGDVAKVRGFSATGDGGCGDWTWTPSSTATIIPGLIVAPSAGTGRWIRLWQFSSIDVRMFGAMGDGVTDDTAAIDAAYAYCNSANQFRFASAGTSTLGSVAGPTLIFTPGRYIYNGTGLVATNTQRPIRIQGAGMYSTQIIIPAGVYFLTITGLLDGLHVSDINFVGGKGAILGTYTSNNVRMMYVIERCMFTDYTECAIGHDSVDMPYWKIRYNIFNGVFVSSMGVALRGGTDLVEISENSFLANKVHIKTSGANANISNNDFIRFANPGGAWVADLWITGTGTGLTCTSNKFGNENLQIVDYRVLFADEDMGTGSAYYTRMPSFLASATVKRQQTYTDNRFVFTSTYPRGFIHTTTSSIRDCRIVSRRSGQVQDIAQSKGLLSFEFAATASYFNAQNFFDIQPVEGSESLPIYGSQQGLGYTPDPHGYFAGFAAYVHHWPVGEDPTYQRLIYSNGQNLIDAAGLNKVTRTAITDSNGSTEARNLLFVSNTSANQTLASQPDKALKPVWIEFDAKQGVSNSVMGFDFSIRIIPGPVGQVFRRQLFLSPNWQRYRLWFRPNNTTDVLRVSFTPLGWVTGVSDNFDVGRIHVYAAHSPVAFGIQRAQALSLTDGQPEPATASGEARIYVDTADGDLKVKFGDGTIKTIVTD